MHMALVPTKTKRITELTLKKNNRSVTRPSIRCPVVIFQYAPAAAAPKPRRPKSSRDFVSLKAKAESTANSRIKFHGVHHVALLCASLDKSLEFYCGILDLPVNPDRPHDKLPYPGAWIWIGPEMIHLMELPNPDPLEGRPNHGGRDRHFCVGVVDIQPIEDRLKMAGVEYTRSMSGRPAIFFRDPDMNVIEAVQLENWR